MKDIRNCEIKPGDTVIVFQNGDRVLESNLENYLTEVLGAIYVTA